MLLNPFGTSCQYLYSNVAYVFALAILLTGLTKKIDIAVSFCTAWLLIVACLAYRILTVCVFYPPGLEDCVRGIMIATPVQIMTFPLLLSMIICCVRAVRRYRKKNLSIWFLILNAALLVIGLVPVLILIVLAINCDFSAVGTRWP